METNNKTENNRLFPRQKRRLLIILCILLFSAACRPGTVPNGETGTAQDPVFEGLRSAASEKRISVYRQRISENFDLSETGIYCLRRETIPRLSEKDLAENEGVFILYCEKDADAFIKACGRPDCRHNDPSCDAYLPPTVLNSYYYKGNLYYTDHETYTEEYDLSGEFVQSKRIAMSLNQMEKNGRNKTKAADLYPPEKLETYEASGGETYSLGYVRIGLDTSSDSDAVTEHLYGCLEEPGYFEQMPGPKAEGLFDGGIVNTTGETILTVHSVNDPAEKDEDGMALYVSVYRWNPEEGTYIPAGKAPYQKNCCYGYDHAYYLENGRIMEWDYESRTEKMLAEIDFPEGDTLHCFPDCFMITDSGQQNTIAVCNEVTARFYDYTYRFLGECTVPLEPSSRGRNVLFGETEERILFSSGSGYMKLPSYYIEKSDFGTGQITLHEYHFPEEGK